MTAGQPGWVAASVNQGAATMESHQAIFNTGAALIQVAIGFGILYKRTTKPAIAVSFAWVLAVWWFGEAFGMLFMNDGDAAHRRARSGAVVRADRRDRVAERPPRRAARRPRRADRLGGAVAGDGVAVAARGGWRANAIHNAINAAPSGMSWLSSVQDGFASITKGNGLIFALVLSAASAAIAIAVARNWRAKEFLILAAVLNLIFWVVGQGFGGIFQGGATDPNAGLLFIVLAGAMYTLVDVDEEVPRSVSGNADRRGLPVGATTSG